jgi:hypothetical protein
LSILFKEEIFSLFNNRKNKLLSKSIKDKNDFKNVCSIINTGRVQDSKKPHLINGWEDRLKKYAIVKEWITKLISNAVG